MDKYKEVEYKGFTIEIFYDQDAQSPQDWGDNEVFLVADHRQFYVKPPKGSSFESVVEDYKETHHIFGLEAYIHSGVSLSLSNEGNFPDRQWDVSQLGAVFVAKTVACTKKKARHHAEDLIKTWNQYLSGEVYGFQIPETEDSCWGFYGDPETSGLLESAKDDIDWEIKERLKKHQAKLKAQIKAGTPLDKRSPMNLCII